MVEADVITGHLIDEPQGEKSDRIPIMGHPPAITSDLSLQEFLDTMSHSEKKLKLDFKSTEAFMLALPVMKNAFQVIIFKMSNLSIFFFFKNSSIKNKSSIKYNK